MSIRKVLMRPSRKPLLLLLPLLALLLFGNCSLLKKTLTQRTAYDLLGDDLKPDQLTRLRAALQLTQQQRQEAFRFYATQPATRRAELKRIEAGIQALIAGFLIPWAAAVIPPPSHQN